MTYTIVKGNDENKFELANKHGVWALHFKRRLKKPGQFDLVIHGKPSEGDGASDKYEKPLTLRVKLVVTE